MEESTLKRIDLKSDRFEANGTTYFIEGALTIERYTELQIFEKEMGYGLTFEKQFEELKAIYKLLNQQKFADCAVKIHNMMQGVATLQEREPIVLKICALFINAKDEDRKTWNPDLITKKITDWKAEGLDMRDFFALASSSVSGFLEIYKNVTQTISGRQG